MDKFNLYLTEYLQEDKSNDICLISGEKLLDNHISLNCGHKFNYKDLYEEVVKQKTRKNLLEVCKLKKNEIKCPYCRNIHKKLLPFNKDFRYFHNVMDVKKKLCRAVIKSGPNKGRICNRQCKEDSNFVCYIHRNVKI